MLCANLFDVNRIKHVEIKCYDKCSTLGEDVSETSTSPWILHFKGIIYNGEIVSIGLDNTNSNMGNIQFHQISYFTEKQSLFYYWM